MALFASPFYGADLYGPDQKPFQSLFRMLDEFDTYSRQQGTNEAGDRPRSLTAVRTFNPKFDVRETNETYELHGDLPGIHRDQINIHFTEPQTLVISGRVERSYTAGNPTAGLLEHDSSHRATVEDAPTEGDESNGKRLAKSGAGEVNKADDMQQQQQKPTDKFWLSERSVGAFSRTFGFPTRVDQDAVKANLENGVLNITVPKAKKQEARRITIA